MKNITLQLHRGTLPPVEWTQENALTPYFFQELATMVSGMDTATNTIFLTSMYYSLNSTPTSWTNISNFSRSSPTSGTIVGTGTINGAITNIGNLMIGTTSGQGTMIATVNIGTLNLGASDSLIIAWQLSAGI